MIIVDSMIVGGLRFILDKIAAAVDGELNDEGGLREQLLASQMQVELGEISDDDFAVIQSDIMARLREIREEREGGAMGASGESRVVGVDVTFGGEDRDER
jgi:hypothetical protein